jgi:hypothetical protein
MSEYRDKENESVIDELKEFVRKNEKYLKRNNELDGVRKSIDTFARLLEIDSKNIADSQCEADGSNPTGMTDGFDPMLNTVFRYERYLSKLKEAAEKGQVSTECEDGITRDLIVPGEFIPGIKLAVSLITSEFKRLTKDQDKPDD